MGSNVSYEPSASIFSVESEMIYITDGDNRQGIGGD
jgi:hypothetical protein